MKRQTFALCGCPRSGTTWLHNSLIAAGRFRGIPGDDSASASRDLLVTDENQYSHALLVRLAGGATGVSSLACRCLLAILKGALTARFGGSADMMLKSPYYSFLADVMFRCEFAQKFTYIRRNIDSVALSMLNHGFLSSQIRGDINHFSSMIVNGVNLEIRHIPEPIATEFTERYAMLSAFDRALFKCLCFGSAFATLRRCIPPHAVFVLRYESLLTDRDHQEVFCDFLELSERQRSSVISSFRDGAGAYPSLPVHDAEFRQKILDAEASLWE